MKKFKIEFYEPSRVDDLLFKYAVIVARYDNKWVLCRHRERNTWEFPGGHRKVCEDIFETAKRELFEETGGMSSEIKAVAAYSADDGEEISYGMLFYCEIGDFEKIPSDSEMSEIGYFDTLPKAMTYPQIQPKLFDGVQAWLNTQNNADELWDVYDSERRFTGKLHRRGDFLGDGEYHLVVHIWMMNSNGEFLLTKRTPNKGFPNMWETTGGSALAGDDSLTAAMREVREETGLMLDPKLGKVIITLRRDDNFVDVWLFKQDFELDDVILLEGETCDKMYASLAKIKELYDKGEFVPYSYIDKIFELEVQS